MTVGYYSTVLHSTLDNHTIVNDVFILHSINAEIYFSE